MHHLQSVKGDWITHAEVGEVFLELLKDKKQNPNEEIDDLVTELAPCVFREDDVRERFCGIVTRVCINEYEDGGVNTNAVDHRNFTTYTIHCVLERLCHMVNMNKELVIRKLGVCKV